MKTKVFDRIEVKELIIKDDQDRERIKLTGHQPYEFDPEREPPATRIIFYDENGKERILIDCDPVPGIRMINEDGYQILLIEQNGNTAQLTLKAEEAINLSIGR